jgi:hypothetical protein
MREAKLGTVLLAAAAALLALAAGQDKPAASEVRPPSVVRMDLLSQPARELTPPKRSIFTPSAEDEGGSEADASAAGGGGLIPAAGARGAVPSGLKPGRAVPNPGEGLPALNLRYVGFVQSPKSIIGLVLVQGQAQAVQAGDVVSDWYQVGSITVKAIELVGPDGTKTTFPLEGDEE